MNFCERVEVLLASNQCFSIFRFPGESAVHLALGLIEEKDDVKSYFVMHPFQKSTHEEIRIGAHFLGELDKLDLAKVLQYPAAAQESHHKEEISDFEYLAHCETAIQAIQEDRVDKVVLHVTRTKETRRSTSQIFYTVLKSYPDAFVHWTHTPGSYDWMGASPELLLSRKQGAFKSMSLAGTRTRETAAWTEKEYREQEFVTAYITSSLKSLGITNIGHSKRYDKGAGHLIHLCTDIEFESSVPESIILEALHPTPAVCGSPKEKALELLEELGMKDRSYYCGYIGLSTEQQSRYFVNLRCMQIGRGKATIYVGGGVTIDSRANDELRELNLKSRIMGSVIEEND